MKHIERMIEREEEKKASVSRLKKIPAVSLRALALVWEWVGPREVAQPSSDLPDTTLQPERSAGRQAGCTGGRALLANGWRGRERVYPPREPLLSSPLLALRACLILPVFEVMELDNKLKLDGHHGKRRTWIHLTKHMKCWEPDSDVSLCI